MHFHFTDILKKFIWDTLSKWGKQHSVLTIRLFVGIIFTCSTWYRGFQCTCGDHHPTIWKFIDNLKTEQGNTALKPIKFVEGKEQKYKNQLATKKSTRRSLVILQKECFSILDGYVRIAFKSIV